MNFYDYLIQSKEYSTVILNNFSIIFPSTYTGLCISRYTIQSTWDERTERLGETHGTLRRKANPINMMFNSQRKKFIFFRTRNFLEIFWFFATRIHCLCYADAMLPCQKVKFLKVERKKKSKFYNGENMISELLRR